MVPSAHLAAPRRRVVDAAEPMFDIIELLFFAYRDFVGDADRLLESLGFGRAHHRVLHFVARSPGLSVAELLDILRITKQSLARVLKDLLGKGYVEQRSGLADRRQRLLFPTPAGEILALDLAGLQSERLARALGSLGLEAREDVASFLFAMVDAAERPRLRHLHSVAASAAREETRR